jgi:serine phosphatase RsbU (regulator of sigma subunit)
MLILVLDPDNRRMEAATAGHYPPMLSDGDAFKSVSMNSQLILGVQSNFRYPTESFELPENTTLLLYTDGVLDAQSPDGERFDEEQLERAASGRFQSAQKTIDDVLAALKAFCGGRAPADDLTLVAIHLPASPEPVATVETESINGTAAVAS